LAALFNDAADIWRPSAIVLSLNNRSGNNARVRNGGWGGTGLVSYCYGRQHNKSSEGAEG
jgi:hypothetical protein